MVTWRTGVNILLIGANPNNSTDGIIVQGIRNLLTEVYGEYTFDYVFLDDHNNMNSVFFYPNKKYDLLVVCGTPWLWDNFQYSTKYKNLLLAFKLHNTKKVFMGIGSCLNLNDINSNILKTSKEIEGMQKLFNDTTIIVRDKLAQDRLNNAGLKSYLLPCPGYFSTNKQSNLQNNVIFWCDPTQTISQTDWQSKEKLDKYNNIFLQFYKRYNPKVYCAHASETSSATKAGLPIPTVLTGWENTLNIVQNANHVLSGRVHCAVPALTTGTKVGLVALDTRSFTLSDFNGTIIKEIEDLNNLKSINLDSYKKLYMEILK